MSFSKNLRSLFALPILALASYSQLTLADESATDTQLGPVVALRRQIPVTTQSCASSWQSNGSVGSCTVVLAQSFSGEMGRLPAPLHWQDDGIGRIESLELQPTLTGYRVTASLRRGRHGDRVASFESIQGPLSELIARLPNHRFEITIYRASQPLQR